MIPLDVPYHLLSVLCLDILHRKHKQKCFCLWIKKNMICSDKRLAFSLFSLLHSELAYFLPWALTRQPWQRVFSVLMCNSFLSVIVSRQPEALLYAQMFWSILRFFSRWSRIKYSNIFRNLRWSHYKSILLRISHIARGGMYLQPNKSFCHRKQDVIM